MTRFRHSTAKFKTKLRLFSFSSARLLPDSSYTECLTVSPCQLVVSSCFLTPLDVRNPDHFTPLTDRELLAIGDDFLPPPPPPRRKLSYGPEPAFSLPAEKPPKVRPFVAASQLNSNGSVTGQICFICDELLETKLEQELLVQLNCGDCVHSECLVTAAEYGADKATRDQTLSERSSSVKVEATIFPMCRGSACGERKRTRPVVPIDEETIRQIVDDVMLSLKLTATVGSSGMAKSSSWSHTSRKSGSWSGSAKGSLSSDVSASLGMTKFTVSAFSDTSVSTATSSLHDIPKTMRNLDSVLSPQPMRTSFFEPTFVPSLDERPIERESCPTSPAFSNITNATASVRISLHQLVLLEHLRNNFIRHLVQANDAIDFSVLVAVGSLRLVDRLQVSFGQSRFSDAFIYLFVNYLVIWQEGRQVEFFDLGRLSQIDSSGMGMLLLRFDEIVSLVELCSDMDSIIQKWGIALSDSLLVFPKEIFSSTISISETSVAPTPSAESSKPSSAPLNNSFVAQVSPIWEDEDESSTPKDKSVRSSPAHTEFTLILDDKPNPLFHSFLTENALIPLDVGTNLETVGVYIYSSSPTIPLNIPSFQLNRRFSAPADSDSDSDSDEDLIKEATRFRKQPDHSLK